MAHWGLLRDLESLTFGAMTQIAPLHLPNGQLEESNAILGAFLKILFEAQLCVDNFLPPQVQQRGPLCCSQLLSGLMDGVEAPDNAVVWVVDLVPNRPGRKRELLSHSSQSLCKIPFLAQVH
jgi:hypothetical protein